MRKIVALFLIAPLFLIAQESNIGEAKVDLSNPNATIYTHIYFLQKDSYNPGKAAKTIYGLEKNSAVDKAIKIKKVLDGKGLYLDFNKIPNNPNYNDSIGYSSYFKFIPFPDRMPQIYVEKIDENWYYSTETVNNIDKIYESVFPWYVSKLQNLVPAYGHKTVFNIEVWQYIFLLIIVSLTLVIFLITKRLAFFILQKVQLRITKHDANFQVKQELKKLAHPISLLVALQFVDIVFPSLQFSLSINKWVFLAVNISQTVFWIYVFLKLVKVAMRVYSEFTERTHGKLDDQLVPILHNFLTGIVIIFGAFKLLHLFGLDTTTLLAGATIGGLAFALASQDTVKNLIGTITIFLDKPFHIGDWIEAGEVTGTVEQVGFRSSRVRASDTSLYQIPNSKLSEMVIKNSGVRLFRRYSTTLGLRYDTPPVLIDAFTEGIRKIIKAHPETRKEAFVVEFTGFGDSALEIMVNVFFVSLAWSDEQASKHKLHIAIVKLAKAIGVDFAFPSSTLMIEQFPDKSNLALDYSLDSAKVEEAVEKIITDFKEENK